MHLSLLLLLLRVVHVWALWKEAETWRRFTDGSDLHHFVTRPELKAPRYAVVMHKPEAVAPGYWFVTPHGPMARVPGLAGESDYVPCVNGLHIYDGNGDLVWSGACQYNNRNAIDFRPIPVNGSDLLTFYLPDWKSPTATERERLRSGVVMNSQYEELSRTMVPDGLLDLHEFNVQQDGKSALITSRKVVRAESSSSGEGGRDVKNSGFVEVEVGTNRSTFSWDPVSAGISLDESCDTTNMAGVIATAKGREEPWDFFHINSVDKFANGDYLVSSRHTSTIYRISGKNGRVIWRLGGCYENSDFTMEEGARFFWQHDARVLFENATHTTISVFDNASDIDDLGEPTGHQSPVGKILLLETAKQRMTAKSLRQFHRPDKGQTAAEGSVSLVGEVKTIGDIERANVLVNWAFDGYISEFDEHNEPVFEARFLSDRKRTYRAFKYPFKGYPKEPPLLKVLAAPYLKNGFQAASVFYVSWNGATEVVSWRFHGGSTKDEKSFEILSTIAKAGFETQLIIPDLIEYAFAEALDDDGAVIGRSATTSISRSNPATAIPAMLGTEGSTNSSLSWANIFELIGLLIVSGFAIFGFGSAVRSVILKVADPRDDYAEVATSDDASI